jgi:hypothetical protein
MRSSSKSARCLEHLGARRPARARGSPQEIDAVGRSTILVGVGLLGDEVDIADELLARPMAY